MIIVLKPEATEKEIEHVMDRVRELGLSPHLSKGQERTIIGVIGDIKHGALDEELQPERDRSRSPLFQAGFTLENVPVEALALPGIEAAPLPLEIVEPFEKKFGGRIQEGYGLTEAGPVTHLNPVHDDAFLTLDTGGLPVNDTEQKIVGVLGVIGPTRLNYARIIPMVDYTAKLLGRLVP